MWATKECERQGDGDIQRCCRLGTLSHRVKWKYGNGLIDAISFSADKDIALHGVCLFGRENATYSVELDVINVFSIVASKTGEFPSKPLQGKN